MNKTYRSGLNKGKFGNGVAACEPAKGQCKDARRFPAGRALFALGRGLAGAMLFVPVASSAADYNVSTATDVVGAITTANSVNDTSPNIILSGNITTSSGTVVPTGTASSSDPVNNPPGLSITAGTSSLTLNGAGTTWNAGNYAGAFDVNGSAGGGLTVSNGAQLLIPDTAAPGFLSFNSGTLSVTGSGSSVTTHYFAVGRGGDATITLTNGGQLTTTVTNIGECCGVTSAANITVLVDGAGTVWNAGYFQAGGATNNVDVTVSNGATIQATDGSGIGLNGAGSMQVTGAGSSFVIADSGTLEIGGFTFGGEGHGTLTISDGALVSASAVLMGVNDPGTTGALIVNTNGILETGSLSPDVGGARVTFDNGILRATADSTATSALISGFAPGDFSIGAGGMFLDSNGFDVTAASVMSGVGDLTKQGAGMLTLTAANTYTGSTIVSAGTLAVGDEVHASATTGLGTTQVNANATLGGYGSALGTVNNGGTLAVANALPAFASGSTGTFRIGGNLNNAGVANLAAASGQIGNVLNVGGNYVGQNGQLILNTLLNEGGAASQSDRLVVAGNVSGSTAIKVNQSGTGALTVNDGIRLVQVGGTSAANSFHLAGPVQAGAYQYLLYQGGAASANDWYLRSQLEAPSDPTTGPATGPATAPAAPSTPLAYRPAAIGYGVTPLLNADYGFTVLGRLHERVGDVANLASAQPGNNNGVWGRIGGQNLDADAGDRFATDERTFLAQFGKDWTLSHGSEGGSTHAGATLTLGSSSASFSDSMRSLGAQLSNATGTVETQAQSVGGYWTKYLSDGTYFDSVGQLTHYQNRYGDIYGTGASQNGFGAGVSAETGKPFALGSTRIAIEPQAQLLYQYLHLNHFDDSISPIGANSTNALRGRLGFRLFSANLGDDTKTSAATPYFTADVLHDFFSPGQTNVGGTSFDDSLSKTWYELGVGVTASLGKSSELYVSARYAHNMGGAYRQNVFGQAGYRYSW